MNPSGNTILITGGGSGIGRALAQRFHDLGNEVVVAGRRHDALVETAAGRERISNAVLDVEDPRSIEQLAHEVVERHPTLNILINCAGIMREEDLTTRRNLADVDATITTNLLGPILLTNALIDHLVEQNNAVVVNVSSGLAFVPLIATPTYSATKAAIHSYSVSLREQLKGKVEVIELVPPAVQTDLTPGQSTREGYMPLGAFIDEVMDRFQHHPTPTEILVERVGFLRNAEREGRFDQTLSSLNPPQ